MTSVGSNSFATRGCVINVGIFSLLFRREEKQYVEGMEDEDTRYYTACSFDIQLYLNLLGHSGQFIETCGT